MAHIQDRPGRDRRWRVRYRGPDGRERSRSFRRKVDAEKFAATVEADKARGSWVDPSRGAITFGAFVEGWRSTLVGLKPKTIENYDSLLRVHLLPRFGEWRIERFTPLVVNRWVASMAAEHSPSVTRHAYRLFAAIMAAAVEWEYLPKTPCQSVRLPRLPDTERPFLTLAEVDRLANEGIGPHYRVLVYTMAFAGPRWGEAVAVRRSRVELGRARLHIVEAATEAHGKLAYQSPKTHRRRAVALPAFLRDMLADHLASTVERRADALVFTTPRGRPLRYSNFMSREWYPALEAAGLDRVGIHALRHTAASLLIDAGAHPKAIQRHLGHSSITTTLNTYGHLMPDEQDQVADALDNLRDNGSRPQRGPGEDDDSGPEGGAGG